MSFIPALDIMKDTLNWGEGFRHQGYLYGFVREYSEWNYSKAIVENLEDEIHFIETNRQMQKWTLFGSTAASVIITFRFTDEQDAVFAALVF